MGKMVRSNVAAGEDAALVSRAVPSGQAANSQAPEEAAENSSSSSSSSTEQAQNLHPSAAAATGSGSPENRPNPPAPALPALPPRPRGNDLVAAEPDGTLADDALTSTAVTTVFNVEKARQKFLQSTGIPAAEDGPDTEPESKEVHLRETFSGIDTDGSGTVNKEEVAMLVRQRGITLSPEELAKAWADMDTVQLVPPLLTVSSA